MKISDELKKIAARLRVLGIDPTKIEDQIKQIMIDNPSARADDFDVKGGPGGEPVVSLKLPDFDVTEELKRRLKNKDLDRALRVIQPTHETAPDAVSKIGHLIDWPVVEASYKQDEDCSFKQLNDVEIITAVKTMHDLRTGRVKPEDITPPIELHPRLVDVATSGPSRLNGPDTRNQLDVARRVQQLHDDVTEDLRISKKIVESMIEEKVVDESQRMAATEIMSQAIARECDKAIVFAPVSGLEPFSAAKRVIKLKTVYSDVEPVDLTGVLDDVNPVCDTNIDKLERIMNVKKTCNDDDLPDEIRFVIPSADIQQPFINNDDVVFATERYVHMDSMPAELQRVVLTYLSLRRGSGAHSIRSRKMKIQAFMDSINSLRDSTAKTLDNEEKREKESEVA